MPYTFTQIGIILLGILIGAILNKLIGSLAKYKVRKEVILESEEYINKRSKLYCDKVLERIVEITGLSAAFLRSNKNKDGAVAARALFTQICIAGKIKQSVIASMISKDRSTISFYATKYKSCSKYEYFKQEYISKYGRF